MSSREFSEWLIYSETSPIDHEWRADLRMARIASLMAEGQRDQDKRRQPFTPDDFMPRFDVERATELTEPDPRQQLARLDQWADVMDAATR